MQVHIGKQMIDITDPQAVQISIRDDGAVVWVNVDGVCRLRCSRVEQVIIEDARERKVDPS